MKTKSSKNLKYYLYFFWGFYSLFVIGIFTVFIGANFGLFGDMPNYEQLENPKTNLATEIISADGVVIGKFFYNDNRTPISFAEIPTPIVDALISTEDERFFSHSGIDFKGTLRALFFLGKKGGGSTITQQLAKQLFVGVRSRNIVERLSQKIKEWVLAIELEKHYTKQEIIAMYLNLYDFGYQADGVKSASQIYFNKPLSELTENEAAILVGMLKNSSLYNPIRRSELVSKRRNIVLNQMLRNDFLSQEETDSLQQLPLGIDYTPQNHNRGIATYFRAYLRKYLKSWINNNPKPDGSKYNLYLDGLKVYTTLDSRLQSLAEVALEKHMKNLQKEFFKQNTSSQNPTAPFLNLEEEEVDTLLKKSAMRSERWRKLRNAGLNKNEIWNSFLQPTAMRVFSWKGDVDTIMTPLDSIVYYKTFLRGSLLSMEPRTGHIKSWVGGINFEHFKYDQVKQGKRQIGSTFKPFLYATVIDQLQLSPCDVYQDALYCIEPHKFGNLEAWCPKNSGNKYGKERTLKNALANSVNTISARLMDMVGPTLVANLAHDMGIESEIPKFPSIALGTTDLSLYEMVAAYNTFANKGVYIQPSVVTRIEDKNGGKLFEFLPETKDVLSEETAYVTLELMKGVTEAGSGQRLRHNIDVEQNYIYKNVVTDYPYEFTNPIAGKTGTTQNQSDGWFLGIVPNLVTGVWVGGEDRSIHFEDIGFGQGATMALPIWAIYMKSIYENPNLSISIDDFDKPLDLTISVDCDSEAKDNNEEDDDFLESLGF